MKKACVHLTSVLTFPIQGVASQDWWVWLSSKIELPASLTTNQPLPVYRILRPLELCFMESVHGPGPKGININAPFRIFQQKCGQFYLLSQFVSPSW